MDDVAIIYSISKDGFILCKHLDNKHIKIHNETWKYFNKNDVILCLNLDREILILALVEFDKIIREEYLNV